MNLKSVSLLLVLFFLSCRKDEEHTGYTYRYEVECAVCEVYYTNAEGRLASETVSGKFVKDIVLRIDVEVELRVMMTATSNVLARATIYKDGTAFWQGSSYKSFSSSSTGSESSSGDGSSPDKDNGSTKGCGAYNGRTLYIGPKGGCYYINKNGNKTYVGRSYCKC